MNFIIGKIFAVHRVRRIVSMGKIIFMYIRRGGTAMVVEDKYGRICFYARYFTNGTIFFVHSVCRNVSMGKIIFM